MRPDYQTWRSRTKGRDQSTAWALSSPRTRMIAVPERRACVARFMYWGLSGSSREDGVDVKQASYEACKEWR
jgi:hypothetical protein